MMTKPNQLTEIPEGMHIRRFPPGPTTSALRMSRHLRTSGAKHTKLPPPSRRKGR